MGLSFSRIWERMFGKKEMRILMVGLDAAGKVPLRFEIHQKLVRPSNLRTTYLAVESV